MREKLPPLGHLLGVVEKHFVKALVIGAVGVLVAGFIIPMHGKFVVEEFGAFFAIYGFVSLTVVLIGARILRAIVSRPEDYYDDESVNGEAYPADQLEVRDHDV